MTSPTLPAAQPKPAEPAHTLTGEFRRHEGFHSAFLEHDRTIIVWLPPGYDADPNRRFPVLYLHDGQNIFDKATSVGEEWRVDETAQALAAAGEIEPPIIVGIYNTGEHRIGEYAPTPVPDKGGGKAQQYGRMIFEELKPLIDREYRTRPDAASTGVGGSSLGGLVTIFLAAEHRGAIGRLAVHSPSVWWDDRKILERVAQLPHDPPMRIWLDCGTNEGEETLTNTRALRDALVARGWVLDQDLRYVEAQGAAHNEQSWAERVAPMLRFLYPAR
jgi:predicted alpha/beta superfamily hydrolase